MFDAIQQLPLWVRLFGCAALMYFNVSHVSEGHKIDWSDYLLLALVAVYSTATLIEAARAFSHRARRRPETAGDV